MAPDIAALLDGVETYTSLVELVGAPDVDAAPASHPVSTIVTITLMTIFEGC
ncbi:hypothetical protein [Virgisporangium aurantiacum]|uniref:Uncharacterized protein n=1 Tax=Virgisporangium aurantiacum TaxID=175570 RepID=A0A8J3ZB73_9ACTN|nr:hypothetical protein [Virgisporangium aurantiacum]GIJ58491.1 hypothetical protein Vau01_060070 [Virgisporangium aurantiacum]